MSQSNKREFSVEVDGQELKLVVVRPDGRTQDKGQLVYNAAFKENVQSGAIVRAAINDVMREQKLWNDEKQKEYDKNVKVLIEGELKLKKGGIRAKEARQIALDMRTARIVLQLLNTDRNSLDSKSAEALAENARYNFYVSACCRYADSGKAYFKDLDDYRDRPGDDAVALAAAQAFGNLYFGLDDQFEAKLPENKFLAAYKFCDDKLRLIDAQGRLIDVQGRLIDEQGRLIDDQGRLVDVDGNLLTEDGEYDVEFSPFLDDDDKPIDLEAKPTPVADEQVALSHPRLLVTDESADS